MKKRLFYLLLALLSVLGILLVLLYTRWGAFLTDDSYYYIKPARDALAGRGLSTSPIFGPLLPIALTALGWLGLEPLVGVRFMNMTAFGATIFLAGLTVKRMGAPAAFGLLAAGLVALTDNALESFFGGLSEAICILLELLARKFNDNEMYAYK